MKNRDKMMYDGKCQMSDNLVPLPNIHLLRGKSCWRGVDDANCFSSIYNNWSALTLYPAFLSSFTNENFQTPTLSIEV